MRINCFLIENVIRKSTVIGSRQLVVFERRTASTYRREPLFLDH